MGNAFLFQKVGKLRKIRDKRKKQLGEHLIPNIQIESVVSAKPIADIRIGEGSDLEICVEPSDMISVYSNRHKIAFISAMNSGLKTRIRDSGGRILGRLKRKFPHSGLIEISILEQFKNEQNDKSRAAATTTK